MSLPKKGGMLHVAGYGHKGKTCYKLHVIKTGASDQWVVTGERHEGINRYRLHVVGYRR